MLRLGLRNLDVSFTVTCLQCVRWRRKPRWLPVAKSKMFRVPERTIIPADEAAELMRLHNNYRTQFRAISRFLVAEQSSLDLTRKAAGTDAANEDEYRACAELNRAWNQKVAALRERRLEAMAVTRREAALNKMLNAERKQKEIFEAAEELVRQEKATSPTFITANNLDDAIAAALASPQDPNFSIDISGQVFHGRETKPPTPEVTGDQRKRPS